MPTLKQKIGVSEDHYRDINSPVASDSLDNNESIVDDQRTMNSSSSNSSNRALATQTKKESARECLAEALGSYMVVLVGLGIVAQSNLSGREPNSWALIATGWGMAISVGIYASKHASASHLSPAVTISHATFGKFPWSRVPQVLASQVLGSYVASLTIYVMYVAHLNPENVSFYDDTHKFGLLFITKPHVPKLYAIITEFVTAAIVVGGINFIIAGSTNTTYQPILIGTYVAIIGMALGIQTDYGINPARDFGPRLMLMTITGGSLDPFRWHDYYFWIPIVFPIAGGIFGTACYKFLYQKT